jgi:hypothetical protein
MIGLTDVEPIMDARPETRNPVPILNVGARGWDHDGWRSGFYPEDLPDDWRFAYYCNEFRNVLVPADYWRRYEREAAEVWIDESGEDFAFFLEVPSEPADVATFLTWAEPLEGQVGGLLLPAGVAGLEDLVTAIPSRFPVMLDGRGDPPNPTAWALMDTGRAEWCWRPGVGGPGARVGLMSPPAPSGDLRALRAQIEDFLTQAVTAREAFLFFEGAPHSITAMRQVLTIAHLLGA